MNGNRIGQDSIGPSDTRENRAANRLNRRWRGPSSQQHPHKLAGSEGSCSREQARDLAG